jgi:hypothetical protein
MSPFHTLYTSHQIRNILQVNMECNLTLNQILPLKMFLVNRDDMPLSTLLLLLLSMFLLDT